MANWCSNTVTFTGEQNQIDQLATLFTAMAKKESEENKGQLPPFITEDQDWLFDISWEDECLFFQTRWSPNIGVIRQIADHYGVGFKQCYMETGNLIFGEATYEKGVLKDIALDPIDFDQCEADEDTNTYTFEKETYECGIEILEILLERKRVQPHENPDQVN